MGGGSGLLYIKYQRKLPAQQNRQLTHPIHSCSIMPTALQFVTFTPSEEYITNERTFEDFASWIVPASRGTFLDGQALHGTRVDDENVAHILFRA